jgi:murein DD-endopeptidase MepM/ murein hydrolase activator NlpD
MGRDLITVPGDAILAPIDAKIVRSGWAYPDGEMTLLVLEGVNDYKDWGSRILYVKPSVQPGAIVSAGDQIGTAQDLTSYYRRTHPDHIGDITCHVHVELTVPVDPAMYLPDHLSPDAAA